MDSGRMQLHDGVGLTCKKRANTDINAEVPSVWAKGRVCVGLLCVRNLT